MSNDIDLKQHLLTIKCIIGLQKARLLDFAPNRRTGRLRTKTREEKIKIKTNHGLT
jgi:hypothetical protein